MENGLASGLGYREGSGDWAGSRDPARLSSVGTVLKDYHNDDRQRIPTPGRARAVRNRRARVGGTLLVCALVVTGCSAVQNIPLTAAWRQARVRNEGYSLLYQLLSQESGAAKLLIIKHADPPIADLIKEIASTCDQAKKELELFRENDRHLSLATTSLPQIERQTRDAIESTVTTQLLFSSGKKFEVRFLFTQAEAMNYAAHLARVLHDQEVNPVRKQSLATLAARCTALHDRAMGLLRY